MGPYDQQELGEMFARGDAFNDDVEAFRQSGGDIADVWNNIYDNADMVVAIWRRKRGGYGYMLVKGIEHCERVIATGKPEAMREATHVVPSPEAAMAMAAIFGESPRARWVFFTRLDGHTVLGLR